MAGAWGLAWGRSWGFAWGGGSRTALMYPLRGRRQPALLLGPLDAAPLRGRRAAFPLPSATVPRLIARAEASAPLAALLQPWPLRGAAIQPSADRRQNYPLQGVPAPGMPIETVQALPLAGANMWPADVAGEQDYPLAGQTQK